MASPFLLAMSIKYSLENQSDGAISNEIPRKLYVDNVALSPEELYSLKQTKKELFTNMYGNIREYVTNDQRSIQTF